LALRSRPSPRDPPDADTCAVWRSDDAAGFKEPRPKPFLGSSFFGSSFSSLAFADPARPAAPSSTYAIAVTGVGSYLMLVL
jgi:hypothetical protein